MKRFFLLLLVATFALTGCARLYTITLVNGNRITTKGKPRLNGANYVFKDATGQPAYVPAGRVREIAPASMASPSANSGFKSELRK